MWFPDGSESHSSFDELDPGFLNRLAGLGLFYAVDSGIQVVCLHTEMVQAIAVLLVRVLQDGQLHRAIRQINGLSSFWRWTRLPETENFFVKASQFLGVVRADR